MKTGRVLIVTMVAIVVPAGSIPLAQVAVDTATVNRGIRPFDRPIDPDSYLISPGERLEVVFVNTKLPTMYLSVNAEGKVINRNLGVIDLSGRTLSQAREMLIEQLSRIYSADQVAISIASIYPVSIQVTGAVNRPGRYLGYTSQTVSEIIDSAGGIAPHGSRRRIVFSEGAKEYQVDLDKAAFAGEIGADPNVYAGRRVHVPHRQTAPVTITGCIVNPREVELLDGDNLESLLLLAGGAQPHATVERSYAANDPQRDIHQTGGIRPGDWIRVPSTAVTGGVGELAIAGAVKKQGHYPFEKQMTLQELISRAGGLESRANLGRAVIFREMAPDAPGSQPGRRYPLWMPSEQLETAPLLPGDSVVIPVEVGYVKVSGSVTRPGVYPYVRGKPIGFYLGLSGGPLANEKGLLVSVVDCISGLSSERAMDGPVLDGDEIVIRRREQEQ